jgi:histidinol-phosphate phosphatase family protein
MRPNGDHPRIALAVVFDRDGTLIHDVPYNKDVSRVVAMDGAAEALARLRRAGIATAVATNQSAVAEGRLSAFDVSAINARMEQIVGPVGPILTCFHAPSARCTCRKPAPGMIRAAAFAVGCDPVDCVVVGDISTDIDAARAAGARAVMVATPKTRPEEIASAPAVAANLLAAVDAILCGIV